MPNDPGEAAPSLRLGDFPDRWLQLGLSHPCPGSDRERTGLEQLNAGDAGRPLGPAFQVGEDRPHPLRWRRDLDRAAEFSHAAVTLPQNLSRLTRPAGAP